MALCAKTTSATSCESTWPCFLQEWDCDAAPDLAGGWVAIVPGLRLGHICRDLAIVKAKQDLRGMGLRPIANQCIQQFTHCSSGYGRRKGHYGRVRSALNRGVTFVHPPHALIRRQ